MSATELRSASTVDRDNPNDSAAKRNSREWSRGKVSGATTAVTRWAESIYSIRDEMRARGIL